MLNVDELKLLNHLSNYQIEFKIAERIKEVLYKINSLNEKEIKIDTDSQEHYDISIMIPYGQIVIEVKSNDDLKTRDVNGIIGRLKKYKKPGVYQMVAAPFLSMNARETIRKENMGYLDLVGNAYIAMDNIYIYIDTINKNPFNSSKATRSVFKRSSYVSGKILRYILNMNEPWRTTLVAKELSVSASRVHEVKEFLLQEDLIDKEKKGFILKDPKRLMRMWAEEYNKVKGYHIECYSIDKANIIERDLRILSKEIGFKYALTGFSGGARYSPTVRYNKVHFYVDMKYVDEIIQRLEMKKVAKGGNVSILIPDDPSFLVNSKIINGDMIVSEVQAYLDLMGLAARGEEMAENILMEANLYEG